MRTPGITTALLVAVWVWSPSVAAAERRLAPAAGRYRVAYATFLGGSQWDQPREIVPCPDGSVLVGGQTSSTDLPVTSGVVQPTYAGEPAGTGHGGLYGGDCFVARIGPRGQRIRFATYFGGSRQERAVYGMAVDRRGNIVITTGCRSRDLPTTSGAYQRKHGGGMADVMLAKLAPDLSGALWCTYLGGRRTDWPRGGIALDGDDNVVVVGRSDSPDFPGTEGVLREKVRGANGDAMVVKVKADGSGLVWATLLGGSDWDGLMGARLDAEGNVYVAGHTRSTDLPVTTGAACQRRLKGKTDGFLAKLSPDGKRLTFCTLLGGGGGEFSLMPTVGADGSIYLVGQADSRDFPVTARAVQKRNRGNHDGVILKFVPAR